MNVTQMESQLVQLMSERDELRASNNMARLILLQWLGEEHANKPIEDLAALAANRVRKAKTV